MPVRDRTELRDGAQVILAAVRRSLRSLDRDRLAALAISALMGLVLLAPWYEIAASAPGAGGTRRVLRQSLSGWQALSVPGILCALAAATTIGLLLTRTGAPVEGLGAAGRRAARSRTDGRIIAVAGAIAGLAELIGLGLPPGFHAALPGATSHTSIRFGLVLGILVAIALTAIGARIAQAHRDPGTPSAGEPPSRPPRRRDRSGGPGRPGRPDRSDRVAARSRDRPAASRIRDAEPDGSWTGADPPQFDFAVDRPPR